MGHQVIACLSLPRPRNRPASGSAHKLSPGGLYLENQYKTTVIQPAKCPFSHPDTSCLKYNPFQEINRFCLLKLPVCRQNKSTTLLCGLGNFISVVVMVVFAILRPHNKQVWRLGTRSGDWNDQGQGLGQPQKKPLNSKVISHFIVHSCNVCLILSGCILSCKQGTFRCVAYCCFLCSQGLIAREIDLEVENGAFMKLIRAWKQLYPCCW